MRKGSLDNFCAKERKLMMKNTNYNNQINKILKEELYFKTDNIEEEIRERLNIINEYFSKKSIYKLHYDNLKYYDYSLANFSPSYFGISWTQEEFFPFMSKHSSETLMILEMLVLSYSKIIYEMVIHDVSYYQADFPCFITPRAYFDKRIFNFTLQNEELLDSYFQVIIDLRNGQREGSLINYQGQEIDEYYIESEMWDAITEKLLQYSNNPVFEYFVVSAIKSYDSLCNSVKFFTDYQPVLLRVTLVAFYHFSELIKYTR